MTEIDKHAVLEAFKERYCILNYDMRGHGQSEAPKGPYTLDMLAEDVLALMDSLKIKRAIYCGLSIGGMIGQTLALRPNPPFERMVLADTTHTQPPEALKQLSGWFEEAMKKPDVQPMLMKQGLFQAVKCGAAFGTFMKNLTDEYGRIIKEAGIKVN